LRHRHETIDVKSAKVQSPANAVGETSSGVPNVDECRLTILIPCLNEAETLAACVNAGLEFLHEAGVAGEVLVSDNGSTDGSQAIAAALGARVVQAPTRGYGGALGDGIAAARGRYVIMGDADDSYDLRHLDAFLAALEGGADLVIGNRFRGGIMPDAMPLLHRYLGNPVLTFIGRLLFGAPVRDFHCGLRGFSREAVLGLGLRTTGMEFASEMVVRASLAGLSIVEVPTTLKKDGRSRAPHLKTWRDGWRHLRFLLLHSPRWTFVYPGLSFLVVGAAITVALLRGPVTVAPGVSLDVHTFLVGCVCMLVGVQVLSFGMIARRVLEQGGVLAPKARYQVLMQGISLETWLRMAGMMVFAGLAGFGWAAWRWSAAGFGPLESGRLLRAMILAGCAVATGVQLGSSAFLIGILEIGTPKAGPEA
jgi:hypothetical protein